jgi:hypothetical protein
MTVEQHRELGEALRAHRRGLFLLQSAVTKDGKPECPLIEQRLARTEELLAGWKATAPS